MVIKSFTLRSNVVKLEKRVSKKGKEKYVVIRSNPFNKVVYKFKNKSRAIKFYNRSVKNIKNTIKRIDMINRAWVRS